MKNLILSMTAGLILLTGCSKDDSVEQIEEQTVDHVYVLNHLMKHPLGKQWYWMRV